jgi:hypothetical protein
MTSTTTNGVSTIHQRPFTDLVEATKGEIEEIAPRNDLRYSWSVAMEMFAPGKQRDYQT